MVPTLQTLGIDQMSVEDRIALATAIWDSIPVGVHEPLVTSDQRLELERRLTEHKATPQDVIPWETVKTEANARFRQ